MNDDARLTYRVFGTPGSERLVVLLGTGIAVAVDPLPAETATRDICVIAIALDAAAIEDPGGYGGETPAERTAAWLVDLIRESLEAMRSEGSAERPLTAGIVAYREAADVALRATVALGPTVDRFALVAVQAPDTPLGKDEIGTLIEGITAKTLIMNGQRDEPAANAAADWYRTHIDSVRVEMVPGDSPLALPAIWGRLLSHVAPSTKR